MRDLKEQVAPVVVHTHHESPKVSVIVPVYKVDRYLTACLNSIVNQTMEELEIIIVDEGDQDRCREIIDYFASRDPRIVAPHQKNGGYGASCNLAFEMAHGEYIAVVESDDTIEPEMYEEMYAYAKELDADVVKTPYYEYFSDGRKNDCCYRKFVADSVPQSQCFSMKEYGQLLQIHASLWAAIYRREYINRIPIRFIQAKGGAYVDVGFRIDTLINTDRIAWLDKPYYNYRVDAIGSTTNNFKLGPMIQRWNEVHKQFSSNQEDYDSYYGKYLILDEYLNTVGWLFSIKESQEENQAILDNMAFVKKETIVESPALQDFQKAFLMEFIEDNKKFRKRASRIRICRKIDSGIIQFFDAISNVRLIFWTAFCMILAYFLASIRFLPDIPSRVILSFFAALLCLELIAKLVRKCYLAFVAWFIRFQKKHIK